MPCDSISVANVVVEEAAAWLLGVLKANAALIAPVLGELIKLLDERGYVAEQYAYNAVALSVAPKNQRSARMSVTFYEGRPLVTTNGGGYDLVNTLSPVVAECLQYLAGQLIGETVREGMETDGFEITEDYVSDAGERVIGFRKEVA